MFSHFIFDSSTNSFYDQSILLISKIPFVRLDSQLRKRSIYSNSCQLDMIKDLHTCTKWPMSAMILFTLTAIYWWIIWRPKILIFELETNTFMVEVQYWHKLYNIYIFIPTNFCALYTRTAFTYEDHLAIVVSQKAQLWPSSGSPSRLLWLLSCTLAVCLFVCLFVCLSVGLSFCQSLFTFICPCVFLPQSFCLCLSVFLPETPIHHHHCCLISNSS